jgi:two-component system, OmpR family, phosphate regulon sensor histidine kinase PhoR
MTVQSLPFASRAAASIGAANIVAAYPHAAILVDADGMVLAVNDAAVALFPTLQLNQPLSFAVRNPGLLDSVEKAGKEAYFLEIIERFPVERAFKVSVRQAGESGILVVFDDQTADRRLERMRVDFVANASHELRTPLASLLGFIETMRGPARNDTAAQAKFLGIMEQQGKRMARLVDDLLSLSRIEMNASIRPEDKVELIGVVRQIIDALKPIARERDVTIHVDTQVADATVLGDRDELLRVFENLIENAIKYGASGKRIDITVLAQGDTDFCVVVRDYGPGVPAEYLPRLTERFYRVNVVASRESGGTGLGLAIVKHIVARHRGRLDIQSTPGEGCQFSIILARGV